MSGSWVGGFLAYEAGAAFGLPVFSDRGEGFPLAWFALFDRVEEAVFPPVSDVAADDPPRPLTTEAAYRAAIGRIQEMIRAGDSYQVNHTVEAALGSSLDPAARFLNLQALHRFPCAAWVHHAGRSIASLSPELFLERRGSRLVTAPIKGTRPRGGSEGGDLANLRELLASPKDRAEHVMIVDMARNDLGRVCETGTVHPECLAEPRAFSTVHHLETRVGGTLKEGAGLEEIMAALFPAASITGAPKRRTMEIIREEERRARGIYTGSVGVIRPGGDCLFNVAIRTVSHDGEAARIGLGGGIVADSDPAAEWRECADKGAFLSDLPEPLKLIETLRLDEAGDLPRLEAHLDRLQVSARALGMPCDRAAVTSAVLRYADGLDAPRTLRLTLDGAGEIEMSDRPLPPRREAIRVCFSPHPVDRQDKLLRHKTTRRALFDRGLEAAKARGCDDAIFVNGAGHVTEGAIRAILVKLDGNWFAPPLADGLLPSVWRAEKMAELKAVERSLTREDLARAEAIVMGNAVQGSVRVEEILN